MCAHIIIQELAVGILHPLCKLTSRWHNCQIDPLLDPITHPVCMDGSIYTKGIDDGKIASWKYSTLSGLWSQLSSPSGVEIEDFVITVYQDQLIWIGGWTYKSRYERELNRKIFLMKNGIWDEERNFIQPLPESVTSINRISASSDGKYLVILTSNKNDQVKLLIFDGSDWTKTYGPIRQCTIGDIIVHSGTVYLIELRNYNSRFCHITSLRCLLTDNNPGWKLSYVFDGYSNLTVASGHVVTVNYDSQNALCLMGFSTVSECWIELQKIECITQIYVDGNVLPNIVGMNNGRLLLMGRMKVKESMPGDPLQDFISDSFNLETLQFDALELTAKGIIMH